MSREENKDIVRRFEDAVDTQNLDAAATFLSPAYVDHNGFPGQPPGIEGFKQAASIVFTGFPNAYTTSRDFMAEGDKVVVRWEGGGTHQGEFMGLPATGKPITITGINIYRVANGKIVDYWHHEDMLGVMQQLGLVPAPGSGER